MNWKFVGSLILNNKNTHNNRVRKHNNTEFLLIIWDFYFGFVSLENWIILVFFVFLILSFRVEKYRVHYCVWKMETTVVLYFSVASTFTRVWKKYFLIFPFTFPCRATPFVLQIYTTVGWCWWFLFTLTHTVTDFYR